MDKVFFTGNIGNDPVLRHLPDGRPVTTIRVASNHTWNDNEGNRVTRTIWYSVSAFGRTAETVVRYMAKGRQVLVEGQLSFDAKTGGPRIWMDPSTGEPRSSFEVNASRVEFLGNLNTTSVSRKDERGQEYEMQVTQGSLSDESLQDVPDPENIF